MLNHNISHNFVEYASSSELSVSDQSLLTLAFEQLDKAYAPYSKFYVGAALELEDGKRFIGSNQENASYPLCMCAERVALYNAGSNEPNLAIRTIAIVARNETSKILEPIPPCGACRQVISEYENRHNSPIRILLQSEGSSVYEFSSIKALLPLGFNQEFLK